jgi:hypothetical protein
MDKEQEILEGYIRGTHHGEDNKLRAAVGSLNAKKATELTEVLSRLNRDIGSMVSNLMINNTSNAEKLTRGIEDQINNLNGGIERQVDNLITSNERLSRSNEKYAQAMKWLTAGLLIIGVLQLIQNYLISKH